jgi:uncharacterized RDD family membrane protein YckC
MERKYQTGSSRFWAALIDGLIFLPLGLLEDFVLLPTENKFGFMVWIIFNILLSCAYSVLLHAKYGQTLGKMVMKVKIVDDSETKPITLEQAFMRDIVGIAIMAIAIIYLFIKFADIEVIEKGYDDFLIPWAFSWTAIELVTMLANSKRRAVHDFIAGTVVVQTN